MASYRKGATSTAGRRFGVWLIAGLGVALPLASGIATAGLLPLLPRSTALPPLENSKRSTFDNGLRVLSIYREYPGTVTVAAFIGTSARAETRMVAGIRYFTARALVECSAAEQPEIVDRIQRLGANVFSGATLDASYVTVTAAAEDVGEATRLLGRILFEVRFSEAAVSRLRLQVSAALRSSGELPEIAAEREAAAQLYPNHPFGWPVEGLPEAVNSFTPEHIRTLHTRSYVPNNMAIVVAGGVSTDQAIDAVREVFGNRLPGSRLPESHEAPPAPRTEVREVFCPSRTALVHIGARAPGLTDPAYPSATVALAALGSGMSSRLYAALRLENSIAYTFAAEAHAAREGARAGVLATCPPDRLKETEGRMLLALEKMGTEVPSSEEIMRAAEYVATSYAIAHQRSVELAHQVGALEMAGGRGLELDRMLPRLLREVTPEQVRDIARQLFATKVRVRVLPS